MIGWNARRECEQLVLQEQRRAACSAVSQAGPVARPLTRNKKVSLTHTNDCTQINSML